LIRVLPVVYDIINGQKFAASVVRFFLHCEVIRWRWTVCSSAATEAEAGSRKSSKGHCCGVKKLRRASSDLGNYIQC